MPMFTCPPKPGCYVTDLQVIANAENPKQGYEKIPVDLNAGAGGAYLYLCVQKLPEGQSAPITGLKVIASSTPVNFADAGWTLIKPDLNAGAGGAYIYILYTKAVGSPTLQKIKDVAISVNGDFLPTYTKHPVDLNQGAGGAFLFLCYSFV